MSWTEAVDGYCERTDPSSWSEPVNALTNAAFLIAAFVMWQRTRGTGPALAYGMVAILTAIGIGSFLFHTLATRWAAAADVIPILLFILLYLFAASRDFLGLTPLRAGVATAAFIPYAAATVPLFSMISWLGSSAGYVPVPILILVFSWLLRRKAPATARGLGIGAGILGVSLTFRTLDEPLCASFPLGTHFMWHILNGLTLGWMIEVYRRHMLHNRASPG
jgi:hypothetical protein